MNIKICALLLMTTLYSGISISAECVILLHGLARTSGSMEELNHKLSDEGFSVANVDYPSRKMAIEDLAEIAITAGLKQCMKMNASPINYVTHSLGGILVRQFYKVHEPVNVKRVVMLGPPNNGSEVVDNLKNIPGFKLLNGPAGMQLGTGENDIPRSLGAVNFELGVIAGTQSINWILSTFLPNPDDGKVSVESAKVKGMCSFVALPATHPFLMKNDSVISEVINFLSSGGFKHGSSVNHCAGREAT